MSNKAIAGFTAAILLLISLFTVREGQSAIILRLGKIVELSDGVPMNYSPGIHVKYPIIDNVLYFDMRLQTLTPQYTQKVLTAEQKRLIVDYYVKWRISDLARFYKTTGGSISKTEDLLVQKVNDALRAEFGQRTISEVVSLERGEVMQILKKKSDIGAKSIGVDVIDVRIKKIDLPQEVQNSVYNRMSADRERVATKHRAQGKAESERIMAQADANVTVILAKAQKDAASIRAAGIEEAANIYNASYSAVPSFYKFYASILAYDKSFSDGDMVILGKNYDIMDNFFNVFKVK